MRRWPLVGLTLAGIWVFVRGVPLEGIRLVEEALIGLGVGLPMAFGFRRLYNPDFDVPRALRAVPAAVTYIVLFLWEVLTANLDVAYRVLHPSMPIDPDVVEIPLRVESDLAVTTIANSISLTPGTVTMDYDPDRNALYVHAISTDDPSAVIAPIRRWEDYALRIFAEPRRPADPVPEARPADGTDATDDDEGADATDDDGGGGEADGE